MTIDIAGSPETSVDGIAFQKTTLLIVVAMRISRLAWLTGDRQFQTGGAAVMVVTTDTDSSTSRFAMIGKTF
jgi:hypothetical protein